MSTNKMSDPEQEQIVQQEFDTDVRKVVDIYRAAKKIGIWGVGLFGFVLVILSIIAILFGFLKKGIK